MKHITDIDKIVVQQALQNNLTKKELSKLLGISCPTLRNWLKSNHIDYNRDKYSYVTSDWLVEKWIQSSHSLNDLSEMYNIPLSTLESKVHSFKLYKHYKHSMNHSIVDKSNPNTCYVAGLTATDGYLGHSVDYIDLTLCGSDEKILLNEIVKYYHTTSSVKEFKKGVYSLSIHYEGLHNFLNTTFNIQLKDKTHTLKAPNNFENEECAKAYILGCMDGDGWISSKTFRFSICTASYDFIYGLQDIIKTYVGIEIPVWIEHRKNGNYPCLGTSGIKAKKFLDWMYSSNVLFKLNRKYQNYVGLVI